MSALQQAMDPDSDRVRAMRYLAAKARQAAQDGDMVRAIERLATGLEMNANSEERVMRLRMECQAMIEHVQKLIELQASTASFAEKKR